MASKRKQPPIQRRAAAKPADAVAPVLSGAAVSGPSVTGKIDESTARKLGDAIERHPARATAVLRVWMRQRH